MSIAAKPIPGYEARRSASPGSATEAPVVLHVRSIAGQGGGPEKTILNSPRYLRKLGYDAYCAFLHRPEELPTLQQRAWEAEAPLISVPDHGLWDLGVVSRLVRLCRRLKPAIWHAHEYKSNLLGLLVRRFWPMKLVTTVHGWVSLQWRCRMYALLDRLFLPHYDAVIAVSDDTYRESRRAGVPASRCTLIHNAIELEQFHRSSTPAEARRRFSLPVRGLLVGAMGRLAEEKGFDVLIRAVAELLRQGHEVTLWIAGEGPLCGKLQDLIDELGCGERIFLLGHVSPPQRFFEALDLFVLSSFREGLPNVVLEAMAMEVPVVATKVAGVPELVDNRRTGLLTTPGSVNELCSAIHLFADAPSLRHQLSCAAIHSVRERFTFARRMEAIVQLYRDQLFVAPSVGSSATQSAG